MISKLLGELENIIVSTKEVKCINTFFYLQNT